MRNPTRIRRGVGRAAPTCAAVLTGLGIAAGMLVASAPAEAAPAEPIEMANLPWNADLDWTEPGAFVADGQWTGPGPDEATYCLRGDPGEELGAQRVFQRSYDLPGSHTGHAQALIMEFESNAVADEAYGTLATWATECEETLLEKGYVQPDEAKGHRVSHPGTEARFTELRYLMQDGGDSEDARSESLGAVRDQNKVALVSMNVLDEREPGWGYEGESSDQPPHPMYSSLRKAADRLIS